MATIIFRCDDALKQRFEQAAANLDMKPSDLARAVFEKTFAERNASAASGDAENAEPEELRGSWGETEVEKKTAYISTRLTPSEEQAVEARAKAMGMKKGTWVMRLIRATLTRNAQLTFDEVHALRQASRELSYVGRNLNQVAHAININTNARDQLTADLVKDTSKHIDEMRERIKAVLDENVYRWGV